MFTGKKKAACAAMLSMAMVAPLAAFAENETRVITCGTLNLRAEESASSKILGKYGWGSEVLVKGVNGDWASVDVGGQSGYMYAKYLGREGTTNSTAYVKTNNRGLNLRAEPNGNILGSYPRGTKVTVLATTGEWSKVSVDGKTGYMQSRWLSGKAVSGDVTDLPILRPVIGMDKEEIVRIARHIGTFETSILPYEDCCTVFTPKHPKTKPVLALVEAEEAKLDVDALVADALANTEKVAIRYYED